MWDLVSEDDLVFFMLVMRAAFAASSSGEELIRVFFSEDIMGLVFVAKTVSA